MGLYDQYQLSNSTQIQKFQGSAVPELMQVGQQLQQQYETGRHADDVTSEMIPQASAASEDQPLLQGLKDKFNNRIADRATKGDYEHMWRETMKDSRNFVQEYKPIAENKQRMSEYQDKLNKLHESGYLRDPATAMKLMAASRDGYKGLQKDPKTGQYGNQFVGMEPAKEINITEWADKALDNFAPQVLGSKVTRSNGMMYITQGGETKVLTQSQIDNVLSAAKKLDPEWQAYANQKAMLDTVGYDRIDDQHAVSMFGSDTASRIFDAAKTSGRSVGEVSKLYAQENIKQGLDKELQRYSSKFVRNDRSSEYSERETEEYGRQRTAAMQPAAIRFLSVAPDTKLEEKDRDVSSLKSSISDMTAALGTLDTQIARASGSEKTILQQQKLQIQDQITSKQSIVEGARNAVADHMGYKNAVEFEKTVVDKTMDANLVPIGGTDAHGKHVGITSANLRNILRDGNYERVSASAGIQGGGMFSVSNASADDYYILHTSNGKVKVEGAELNKLLKPLQQVAKAREPFDNAVQAEVKTNAQNYAMKPMNMSLTKEESEGLEIQIHDNPSGHAFFKPGSTERVADDKLPKDFQVGAIQLFQKSGSYYLTAHGLSGEKGSKGQPDGSVYNIQVSPGSNYGKVIASNLLKRKEYLTPDMAKAAAVLSGFTFSGDIMDLDISKTLTVRKDGHVFATVKREPYNIAGGSRYVIHGSDGKVLKKPDGTDLEYDDALEADEAIKDSWLRSMEPADKK